MPLLKKLEGWSFRLFGGFAPFFLNRIFQLKPMLERARIKIYPETYVSLMFLVAALTLPVTIISTVLLFIFGFMPILFLVPFPVYIIIGFMFMPMSERLVSKERCRSPRHTSASWLRAVLHLIAVSRGWQMLS